MTNDSSSRISIIVPVYNVAPYLEPMLTSLLGQTFTAWEAILVNDGSTDRSGAILDDYATKDVRFKVLHKQNGGVNTAREYGLTHASCDYITFLDADDLLPPMALENMLTAMEKNDVDIVVGQQFLTFKKEICPSLKEEMTARTKTPLYPSRYDSPFAWNDLDYMHLYVSIWFTVFGNKLYKRSLWEGVEFPHHMRMGEDQIVVKQALLNAKKIIAIPNYVYIYKKRAGSATTKRRPAAFDIFETYTRMSELFQKRGIYEQEYTHIHRYFYLAFLQHMQFFLPYRLWFRFTRTMQSTLKECDIDKLNEAEISFAEKNAIRQLAKGSSFYLVLFTLHRMLLPNIRGALVFIKHSIPFRFRKKLHRALDLLIRLLTKIQSKIL